MKRITLGRYKLCKLVLKLFYNKENLTFKCIRTYEKNQKRRVDDLVPKYLVCIGGIRRSRATIQTGLTLLEVSCPDHKLCWLWWNSIRYGKSKSCTVNQQQLIDFSNKICMNKDLCHTHTHPLSVFYESRIFFYYLLYLAIQEVNLLTKLTWGFYEKEIHYNVQHAPQELKKRFQPQQ